MRKASNRFEFEPVPVDRSTGNTGQRFRGRWLLAITVLGAFAIGPVSAQDAGQRDPDKAEQADEAVTERPAQHATSKKGDKVCELEVVTGSRMKKRVCYTPEQWEARQRAGIQLTRELDNRTIPGNHEPD